MNTSEYINLILAFVIFLAVIVALYVGVNSNKFQKKLYFEEMRGKINIIYRLVGNKSYLEIKNSSKTDVVIKKVKWSYMDEDGNWTNRQLCYGDIFPKEFMNQVNAVIEEDAVFSNLIGKKIYSKSKVSYAIYMKKSDVRIDKFKVSIKYSDVFSKTKLYEQEYEIQEFTKVAMGYPKAKGNQLEVLSSLNDNITQSIDELKESIESV